MIIKKGQKFNRLTAIKFVEMRGKSRQYWLFKCDCGNKKIISVGNVKSGQIKSCGCLRKKHGMTKTRTYISWQGMKGRCFNKNREKYKDYGARGITVCDRWLGKNGFENFYTDMGERPEGKTLDRIDNNGNYCPENCRWSSPKEQANNQRSNILITYKGKTKNMKQWSEELGIKYDIIGMRIRKGWDIKKALNKQTE